MSARRGILLEIAGSSVGFTANETSKAGVAASHATSFVEAIRAPLPPAQSMSIDPFDGSFSYSGCEVKLTKEAGLLLSRKTEPRSFLVADISELDLALRVIDATFFDASGTVYLGEEAATYTTKTYDAPAGNWIISGLTRGALGTHARSHGSTLAPGQKNEVSNFNPQIVGRRCSILWYDFDTGAVTSSRFVGTIDDVAFDAGGFALRLLSNGALFEDAEIMSKKFATGSIVGAVPVGSKGGKFVDIPAKGSIGSVLHITLDDPGAPLPGSGATSYLQIGDEVFAYTRAHDPATSAAVGNYAGSTGTHATQGNFFEAESAFLTGDVIRWSSGGAYVYARATRIEEPAITIGYGLAQTVFHDAATNPAALATVQSVGRVKLEPLIREQFDTQAAEHKIGDAVKEVRLISGNYAEIVLRLLLSDTGTGINSAYDTLIPGFGAAIDVAFVSVPAFEALIPLCPRRELLFDEAEPVTKMLRNLARLTGARIFVDEAGVLTARFEKEIYPDSAAVLTITSNDLAFMSIPVWTPAMSNLYNSWTFRGNARGTSSEYKDKATFRDEASIARYRVRPLPDFEDKGLYLSRKAADLEVFAFAVLSRWSEPNPILEIEIKRDEGAPVQPGEIVSLTLPHLPDLAGVAGLSGALFEVLGFEPNDEAMSAGLRLASMPPLRATRNIAPAAVVNSVAGSVLTLHAQAASYLAPVAGSSLATNAPGGEDVDYFADGVAVSVLDVSSLGSGAVLRHATTASPINYGSREITLASLPGWTIAAGDVVRLGTSAALIASGHFVYLDRFAFFGLDPSHVWGL